jgi:hypothetical protein
MGLDMYAYTTQQKPDTPVDFKAGEVSELHYWRKHPDLHGWMQTLYVAKGGSNPEFNCAPVVLTAEDLDRLESDIRAGALPPTRGFFFGATDGSEKEDDLTFIAKAREAIAEGLTVYYDSWW